MPTAFRRFFHRQPLAYAKNLKTLLRDAKRNGERLSLGFKPDLRESFSLNIKAAHCVEGSFEKSTSHLSYTVCIDSENGTRSSGPAAVADELQYAAEIGSAHAPFVARRSVESQAKALLILPIPGISRDRTRRAYSLYSSILHGPSYPPARSLTTRKTTSNEARGQRPVRLCTRT